MLDRGTFERQCTERGLRRTPQRWAVYEVLASDPRHPSAEVIHEKLRGEHPHLSLTTVYRILETLRREGIIRRVDPAHASFRYDARLDPHQHLVCRGCGKIEDVAEPEFAKLEPASVHFEGFQVEEIGIQVLGLCQRCRLPEGRIPSKNPHPREAERKDPQKEGESR